MDKKILGDIFDATPSFSELNDKEKILLQKDILRNLWFSHPNFKEGVIKRAKTLPEFHNISNHEIVTSILGDEEQTVRASTALMENHSFDILERYPVDNILKIFSEWQCHPYVKNDMFLFITKQQKQDTEIGNKIDVNFIIDADKNYISSDYINYTLESPNQESVLETLTFGSFIELFSNSEINQNFKLTDKFGNRIIETFKQHKSVIDICNLYEQHPTFIEQLNENQRESFLVDFESKLSAIEAEPYVYDYNQSKILSLVQNYLDRPGMKNGVLSVLNKLAKLNTPDSAHIDLSIGSYNKQMQDLLEKFSKSENNNYGKINFIKFDSDKFNKPDIDEPDADENLQKLKMSPLKVSIPHLNANNIKKIKNEIVKGELDASKILSLDILKFESLNDKNIPNLNIDQRASLLVNFIKLFPNLKHVEIGVDKELNDYKSDWKEFNNNDGAPADIDSESGKISLLEKLKSLDIVTKISTFNDYSRRDPDSKIPSPQIIQSTPSNSNQFNATNPGDPIYIGDAKRGKDKKKSNCLPPLCNCLPDFLISEDQEKPSIFTMEETGKIISRTGSLPLSLRDSLEEINPNLSKKNNELFIKADDSKKITEINKITQQQFEGDTNHKKEASTGQTICSFTRNLKKIRKHCFPQFLLIMKLLATIPIHPKPMLHFLKMKIVVFIMLNPAKNVKFII